MKEKIALFCNVEVEAVISNLDARSIYEVPVMLEREGLGKIVEKQLRLPPREPDLREWEEIAYKTAHPKGRCNIAVVGKYVALHDAYKRVAEALHHGGLANDARAEIIWVDSDKLSGAGDDEVAELLGDAHGILVPGGSDGASIEGILKAIRWARENKVPFFGICLGLQCAVIEIARNVMGLADAHSTEFGPDTTHLW